MKINHALLLLVPIALLRGCTAPEPQRVAAPAPPAPKPYYLPAQSSQPPPQPASSSLRPSPRPAPDAWRDAPPTPGAWTYAAEAGGSAARFGLPGAPPLLVLRCDRARPAVLVLVPVPAENLGAGTVPAAITTSTSMQRLSATPASGAATAQNAGLWFEIALNTADQLLDSMAFSRGRFMVEMGGAPTLYLPAWAEIGRLIEDCR